MTKNEKLLKKFLLIPTDLTWDEFIIILNHYGFKEKKTGKTSGSARKFENDKGFKFTCHEPHKPNIVKKYIIRKFIEDYLK